MSDHPPPPSEERLLEAHLILSDVHQDLVDMYQVELYDTDEIKSAASTVSYVIELLDTIGAGLGDIEQERQDERDAAERIARREQETTGN